MFHAGALLSRLYTKEGRWDETAFGVKQWQVVCAVVPTTQYFMTHTARHCFTPNTVSSHLPSFVRTVGSLISPRSRDSISTLLSHSIQFKSPNEQGGAIVEIESRDRGDLREPTVLSCLWLDNLFPSSSMVQRVRHLGGWLFSQKHFEALLNFLGRFFYWSRLILRNVLPFPSQIGASPQMSASQSLTLWS